jgi:hypothetical protein
MATLTQAYEQLEIYMTAYCVLRDEVTGDWRKLRNEELLDFCSAPNIIRAIE